MRLFFLIVIKYMSSVDSDYMIEIVCFNNLSVIITPTQRDNFMSFLSKALQDYNGLDYVKNGEIDKDKDNNNSNNVVIDIDSDSA